MTILTFRKTILDWYKTNRRDMPWRETNNPYKILVSEIMLQQTQVARIFPKYEQFLQAFPTVQALAKAPDKQLLKIWSGLGYWRRARFLKAAAQKISKEYKGIFPTDSVSLEMLPGIGPYTSRALACFAFGSKEPFLDTNIRRVFLHFFFSDREQVDDKEIMPIAAKAVWKANPREWHYALFDYGSTVLKAQAINKRSKHYHKQSVFVGSFRSFRTLAVKQLLEQPNNKMAHGQLLDFLDDAIRQAGKDYSSQKIINDLLKDKLIKQRNTFFYL